MSLLLGLHRTVAIFFPRIHIQEETNMNCSKEVGSLSGSRSPVYIAAVSWTVCLEFTEHVLHLQFEVIPPALVEH